MRARLLIVAVVVAAVLAGGTAAAADPGAEQRFADLADRERTSSGIAALTPAADLAEVARRHAERMAAAGRPYHNPNLTTEVANWEALAENVGSGGDVDSVHGAFMTSASHRDHILDPAYLETGVGVVWADGVLYVSVVFRRPAGATAEPAPPPSQPSEPAEAPAPQPPPASDPAPQPVTTSASSSPAPAPPATAAPSPAAAPTPSAPPPAPRRVTVRAQSLPHAGAVVPAPVVALSGSAPTVETYAASAMAPAAPAGTPAPLPAAAALLAAATVAAQFVVVRRRGFLLTGALR